MAEGEGKVSQAAGAISHAGKTYSMELILFPIFLLLIGGAIANNFQSFGIQSTPTLPATCQQVAICYPTNINGCDNSKSNCNFTSSTTFSFLNPNSPFTFLMQGNLQGFFSCIFGCSNAGTMQNFNNLGACTNFLDSTHKSQFITFLYCGSGSFFNSQNVPNGPYNASSVQGNNSLWSIFGTSPPSIVSAQTIYIANGTTFNNIYFIAIPGFKNITFTQPVFTCSYQNFAPFNQTNIQYCLIRVVVNLPTSVHLADAFTAFAIFAGIFLVLAGFGFQLAFQVAATGASGGVNEQATRMAQVFGFGLLVWGFIYSEFGSTLLNGLILNLQTIAFVGLTASFFLGMYWRLFSLD